MKNKFGMGICCEKPKPFIPINYAWGQCYKCTKKFSSAEEPMEHNAPIHNVICYRCKHEYTTDCERVLHDTKHEREVQNWLTERKKQADEEDEKKRVQRRKMEEAEAINARTKRINLPRTCINCRNLYYGNDSYCINCIAPLYRRAPDGTTQGMRHQYMVNRGIM